MTEEKQPRRGPRITRVYTKTGDSGETGLVGGQRVPKTNARIESYGQVDELSSFLGQARLELEGERARFTRSTDADIVAGQLRFIQNQLFTLGGDLATRLEDRHPAMPVIGDEHLEYLESLCDAFNADLEPLKDFILPGGSRTAAAIHVCRTVCRRAERHVVRLSHSEEIGAFPHVYLNRLSDAFFVLGRWVNMRMGVSEYQWDRSAARPPLPGGEG